MRYVCIGMIGAVVVNLTLSTMVPKVDQEAFVRTYLGLIVTALCLIAWELTGLRRRR